MFDKLRFIVRFIRSTFRAKGFDALLSRQLNKAARDCLGAIEDIEREDLETEDMDAFVELYQPPSFHHREPYLSGCSAWTGNGFFKSISIPCNLHSAHLMRPICISSMSMPWTASSG